MRLAPPAQWRRARCPLCTGSLLVRDDAERVVCADCGGLLDVLPSAEGTTVRHAGEALEAARATLELDAVERALTRLRERQSEHAVVARDVLRSARLRQTLALASLAVGCLGLGLLLVGHTGLGALLLLGGAYVLVGALGVRRGFGSSFETDQRSVERQAQRQAQALAAEIGRRERLLGELRAQRLGLRRS